MKLTILVDPSLEISNTIISNQDKGKYVRFIFSDISNPFDKVRHKGLLFKLESYGIDDNTLIENYLNDRVQRAVLNGFYSTFQPISAGVPQGSVLGPFLFFLYIKDIADNLVNNIRLFAGDTSLFIVVDNDPNVAAVSLTSDLDKIDTSASTLGVDLNPSKTCNIKFKFIQAPICLLRF